MSQRYLVRGETSAWFLVGRILGPLAMVGGAATWLFEPFVGAFIFGLGLLLTVIFEISAFVVRRRRCWIEVQDAGFTVIDRRGERSYRDDEVHSIAYSSKNNFSNGEPSGYTRTCILWLLKEPQPLRMENRFKQNQADPLAGFIDRLIELLHDGFNAALEAGHAISGDGWRLTQQELFFRRQSREESLRMEEISAVESREGKMGVWRKGTDEPYVQFPVDGRNVWLLRLLVQSRLQDQQSAEGPQEGGLGRILFQRRPGLGTVVGLAGAGLIAPPLGIGLMLAANDTTMFVAGLISLIASPLLLLGAWACKKSNFRCHEWGVYKAGITGESRLMYNAVSSFSYSATRHYHNGVYTGTHLTLRFEPMPGSKDFAIQYSTQVKNDDADLDELRDFVSGVIAVRLRREYDQGASVAWTRNMTFRPEGIEYTPSGFFGKKQTALLTHENYGGWNMDQGVFYLFERGKPKAVMSEQVSEANFYPGFFLLLGLYHQQQEASATA